MGPIGKPDKTVPFLFQAYTRFTGVELNTWSPTAISIIVSLSI